jgi:hypothetical protein
LGLSKEQIEILQKADRIVIGTLDSDRVPESEGFHGQPILGAIEVRRSDVRRVADALLDSERRPMAFCEEFYPHYAVRIWSSRGILDLLIQVDCGMYALTPTEQRYCPAVPAKLQFIEDMTSGLPDWKDLIPNVPESNSSDLLAPRWSSD